MDFVDHEGGKGGLDEGNMVTLGKVGGLWEDMGRGTREEVYKGAEVRLDREIEGGLVIMGVVVEVVGFKGDEVKDKTGLYHKHMEEAVTMATKEIMTDKILVRILVSKLMMSVTVTGWTMWKGMTVAR